MEKKPLTMALLPEGCHPAPRTRHCNVTTHTDDGRAVREWLQTWTPPHRDTDGEGFTETDDDDTVIYG